MHINSESCLQYAGVHVGFVVDMQRMVVAYVARSVCSPDTLALEHVMVECVPAMLKCAHAMVRRAHVLITVEHALVDSEHAG